MLRLTWRNLVARKVRLIMSTLAIVLGIGFLAGVMTFSSGLGSTFDNIVKGSTGDGVVRPAGPLAFQAAGAGTTQTLDPRVLRRLEALPEVAQATGTIDGLGSFLLGKDDKLVGGQGAPTLAFNHASSKNMLGEDIMVLENGAWPEKRGEVTLDVAAADRGGYDVGDKVTLILPFGEARRTFTLVGTANFNGGGTAGAILVLFETRQAQELFLGGKDAFTSASLTAAEGVSQKELVDAARQVLPDGFVAMEGDDLVEETQEAIGQFIDVISIFLTTFAVIAIVVGAFIIFNTFSILVSQRVRESALLRALGASKKQVTRSVLIEAFVMAVIGSSVGVLLGLALARVLAALFRAIGLDISGDVLNLTPAAIASGYAVGIVTTMVAAYVPARRAAKVSPVAAMRDDLVVLQRGLGRRLVLGTIALGVGVALVAAGLRGAPGTDAVWIGAGSVVWVITVAVMAPVVGHPLLVACRSVFGRIFGTSGRLAGENALRNPRRTGATASALMIGLAVVSAVGVLASSLDKTNDVLVDREFHSDLLVQSPTFQGFPTSIGDDMEKVDGVALVTRQQGTPAVIGGERSWAVGVDDGFREVYRLEMLDGRQRVSGNETILSRSTATELNAGVRDTIKVSLAGGEFTKLKVVGVFADTPVAGGVTVPLSLLEKVGLKRIDTALSINLDEGADADAVNETLDEVVADTPIVSVQDKEEFTETISAQINQLLYMIYGLLALAVVIAVIGIVNTLGLSVLERTREIGLLRAVGLSRRHLRRMITLESVAIALLGAVLGMIVGLAIGIVLRHSLKDDLTELALPLSNLGVFLVVAVVFGVLAAVVPAVRASRMKVLEAIAAPE